MNIIFHDGVEVSIEFESSNEYEKQVLRAFYSKWIKSTPNEKEALLEKIRRMD